MLDSKFLKELNALCEPEVADFAQVKSELEGMFGDDKIVSYLLIHGANPLFPNTLVDVFALSEHCLYDYEIRKKGSLCHMLFLNYVSEITERHPNDEFMEFHFNTSSGGLVLGERKDRKKKVREFCMKVKDRILASKESTL